MTFTSEPSSARAARLAELQRCVPPGRALLAVDQANVRFASGVSSMAETIYRDTPCWAVITDEAMRVLVAGMEAPSLAGLDGVEPYGRFVIHESGVADARLARDRSRPEVLAGVLGELGVDAAVTADPALTAADALALDSAGIRVTVDGTSFDRARARKDPDAVAALTRANVLAETAILDAFVAARAGDTERDVARRIVSSIVAGGGWPTLHVVGFGARSALPEAWPSHRALATGDIVRVDIGCMIDGWHADISRTAVYGSAPWAERAYAAVLAGERAAIHAAAPGVPVADLFAAAVDATRAAGLPEFSRTHCGHGIGLSVYEGFLVSPTDPTVLQPGHVLCVETPHYDLHRGGVQIEEAIVITDDGARRLGHASSELLRIGAG